MVAVSFRCGHGAEPGAAGVVSLGRVCPLCMLIDETHRSRRELLGRVAPPHRAALARETRIGATYDWVCTRGHDRYSATVREVLTGTACVKCRTNATAPAAAAEAGVPFMNPALRTRTSQTEQRLKGLLGDRIRLNHRVNAIHIARTFYGRREVWPDVIVPQLRIAVEYDDPGRSRRAHMGLKEASDLEKDDALREVGWEVIRIRAGGLGPVGPHSIVCGQLTPAVVDDVVDVMRGIRGDAAVDALLPAEAVPEC
jgi:very-short-patch-repair endonuclease